MGTRLSKRQVHRRDHEAEAWCLAQSVVLGLWLQAGLKREVVDGRVVGYWKRQRCGCMFVIDIVEVS